MLGFSDMTLYSHGRRPGPGRQYYRLIGRSAIKPEDSEPDQPDSTPSQDCYREQMGKFLDALRDGHVLADGAMGSYLFELTGRLSEQNHVYEAFNIDRPEIVRRVHTEYLQAGARCLTANTFGANEEYLRPLGETGRIDAINRAGVEAARQAIASHAADTETDATEYFVMGSVGPILPAGATSETVRANYGPQVAALVAAGVDAILLETFTSLEQAVTIADLVTKIPDSPPVVMQMTLDESPENPDAAGWDGLDWNPESLLASADAHGVAVVGVNCLAPWDATAFLDIALETEPVRAGRVHISAMPNAGGFRRIGQRFMNHVNPEFMGRLSRTYAQKGVGLIGGCCEVHPRHIVEMSSYLRSETAGSGGGVAVASPALPPIGDAEKRLNGPFSRKLMDGDFAVSVELLPPRGTAPRTLQSKIDFIVEMAELGLADAIDITDGSRGIPLMLPGDFISLARARLGLAEGDADPVELIPHFTTRDSNLMGLQARLIGLHARGIHNLVIITGDPPKMSPTYPRSSAVFDLDSTALISHIHHNLNAGVDFGGAPLGRHKDPRTRFTIGTGFEPEALNKKRELERLKVKIDAGADYIFTQPVFRPEALSQLDTARQNVAILPGVMLLAGLDHARRMADAPGIVIPDAVFERLGRFDDPEDQAKEGRELVAEQLRQVKSDGWAGAYVMATASHEHISDVLQAGLG